MDAKKYLLYQLSAAKAQVDVLEKLIGDDAPAAEPKSAPKAKAKAKEVEADELAEGEASEAAEDMFGDDGAADEDEATIEDVRKAVKDFATKHGKEKALKLLSKFKATAIPDIKKGDWSKVIELCKKHT